MRAAESCLRAVLSVCLPGAVRNLGEAAGGQKNAPAFLSTDLGDEDVGMGAVCPLGITSWEIDGETVETVSDFIFLGSKITADGDCSHEIKRGLLLGRKAMTNLDSVL